MARKVHQFKQRLCAAFHWLITVVLLSNIFGILPAKLDKWNLHSSNPSISFKFQTCGLVFTLLQIFLVCEMIYEAYIDLSVVLQKPNALLFQLTCIIISTNIKSFLLNVNSLLFGMRDLITCLNNSTSVLIKFEGNTKPSTKIVIIFAFNFFVWGTFPIFIRWFSGSYFSRVLPFVINGIQEVMVSILLITLLTISHISLEDINSKIISLNTLCSNTSKAVKSLMLRHLEVCELFDCVSHCFGFNVVLQCGYNLSKIVLLSYYSYFMLVTRYKINIEHLITVTEVPYRCLAIWYLGHKCDQITYQKAETQRLLAELMIRKYDSLEKEVKEAIHVFQLQLRSRSWHFSACGLFKFGSSTFYGILQIAVTYIVVLVQFHSFM